jgi:hypothetical protein
MADYDALLASVNRLGFEDEIPHDEPTLDEQLAEAGMAVIELDGDLAGWPAPLRREIEARTERLAVERTADFDRRVREGAERLARELYERRAFGVIDGFAAARKLR